MSKDASKISSNRLEDLPEYLGLGVLNSKSLERTHGSVSADYEFENEVIYKVSVGDKDFQIVELLDGLAIATTSEHVSLQETFFHHLVSQLPYQSKRFERLFHRLSDNRNIIVRFAQQPQFFYYPAGYLFSLRQPIVNSNKSAFDHFEGRFVDGYDSSGLKFEFVRDGLVLQYLEIVDFSCTLNCLASSVDLIWQSGMVPKEKEYQLMVLDNSLSAAGNISIYLGDISRDIVTYSVIVTESTGLDLEQTRNNFRASSLQLLKNPGK